MLPIKSKDLNHTFMKSFKFRTPFLTVIGFPPVGFSQVELELGRILANARVFVETAQSFESDLFNPFTLSNQLPVCARSEIVNTTIIRQTYKFLSHFYLVNGDGTFRQIQNLAVFSNKNPNLTLLRAINPFTFTYTR